MHHGVLARSLTASKFDKQALLWDMGVFHPANMAKPLNYSLAQEGCHASEACHLKDSGIGDSVLAFDVQDLWKTAKVKDVQFSFLSLVCGPRVIIMIIMIMIMIITVGNLRQLVVAWHL